MWLIPFIRVICEIKQKWTSAKTSQSEHNHLNLNIVAQLSSPTFLSWLQRSHPEMIKQHPPHHNQGSQSWCPAEKSSTYWQSLNCELTTFNFSASPFHLVIFIISFPTLSYLLCKWNIFFSTDWGFVGQWALLLHIHWRPSRRGGAAFTYRSFL